LVNKTRAQAREFFNIKAQTTQQFRTRESQFRKVNELSLGPSVETQLSYITAMLNELVTGGVLKVVVCGICCLEGHATNAWPAFQGSDVNAMFSKQGKKKYDPYSNTSNEGWKDHPNLRYGPRNNPLGFNQLPRQPFA